MTKGQIARATDAELQQRGATLLADASIRSTEAEIDAIDAELDLISDELARRRHDLADPSSGLGCHQPS
jgi:hypothetical protein